MPSRFFRDFWESVTEVWYSSGWETVGKSAAGNVCNEKRDFPAETTRRLSFNEIAISAESGSARRISRSLRAATVVVASSSAGADFGMGNNLDFGIGRQKRNGIAFFTYENIGQNRQRVSAFDDAADNLQWTKKIISAGFYQLHMLILEK